jgi:hypothetical protein
LAVPQNVLVDGFISASMPALLAGAAVVEHSSGSEPTRRTNETCRATVGEGLQLQLKD